MRILHLVNEVVDTGNGIVNVTVDLAITQSDHCEEVGVASRGGGFVDLLAEHGVEHTSIDFRAHPLSALRSLRQLIQRFRPDVVHAHTIAPCAVAAAVRGIPGVPDFALVATMHNVYQRSSALMASADMTIGVAEAVSGLVRTRRWRSPMVETVVNGVVASPRRTARDHAAPAACEDVGDGGDPGRELGPRSIVTVGAVSHRKGADILLEAFTELAGPRPDVHLWFVGNLDWDELSARVRTSGFAERVHMPGLSRLPASYLAAATVVAIPSRREGLALSLLEAREVGAAIVATETDGAREGLDEGAAGVLVPVEDPSALATALARVLDDPAHREELRRRSATDLDRFSVGRMSRDYHDRYHQTIAHRRKG